MILATNAYAMKRPFKVVIDPGHGGVDRGTVFQNGAKRVTEKDMTLAIAKLVTRKLKASGIQTVLTRSTDIEVPLAERTAIANRIGADVFISIHMNSTPPSANSRERGGEGVETYILNNATDASSKRLAHLENKVLGGHAADSPDHNMDVALILKDLRLDANMSESKRLACTIQDQLSQTTSKLSLGNRGVKQSLFHVLLGADMPSVLVEAGFLSSARDRELIQSDRGRALVSSAIANAVEEFKRAKSTREALLKLSRCKVN